LGPPKALKPICLCNKKRNGQEASGSLLTKRSKTSPRVKNLGILNRWSRKILFSWFQASLVLNPRVSQLVICGFSAGPRRGPSQPFKMTEKEGIEDFHHHKIGGDLSRPSTNPFLASSICSFSSPILGGGAFLDSLDWGEEGGGLIKSHLISGFDEAVPLEEAENGPNACRHLTRR
jgi:hypothetical protein